MKKLLIVFVLCVATLTAAQNASYQSIAIGTLNTSSKVLQAIAGATVTVFDCTAGNCSSLSPASLCTSITDGACALGNTVIADGSGNFGFYIKPTAIARYAYTITAPGFATLTYTDVIINVAQGDTGGPTSYAVQVNGVGLTNGDTLNFNDTTPVAPTNGLNIAWSTSNLAGVDRISGALVGDGNAAHYLDGTGNYTTPSGGPTNVPIAVVLTANNYTNATTLFNGITDGSTEQFKFAVSSNVSYSLSCELVVQGTATTAGPKFQLTVDTGSANFVWLSVDGATNATAYANAVVTALSTPNTALGTLGAGTTNFIAHLNAGFSINATTHIYVNGAANGSGTVTILKGSACYFWQTT